MKEWFEKMMDGIKTMQDTENIKTKLREYINRVEMGSETENEFLRHEITKTYKKNTFIGRALQEMNFSEQRMLLGGKQTEQSTDSYVKAYKEALNRR